MLFQLCKIPVWVDSQTFLTDDRAAIHPFIHKVDRDTRLLHARLVSILNTVRSRKFRQIRRMQIHDPVREGFEQHLADKTHIAAQHDQLHPVFAKDLQDRLFIRSFAIISLRVEIIFRDPVIVRPHSRKRLFLVHDYTGKLDRKRTILDM